MNEAYTFSGLLSMVAVCLLLFLFYRRYPTRFWKKAFKKFTFAAFGMALLLILPISKQTEPLPIEIPPSFEEDPYIRLTATASSYTLDTEEITFTISVIDSSIAYMAGNDWILERYTGGQWTQYSTAGDIDSMGYIWEDGLTMTHRIGPFRDPGYYRLVKSVRYEDGRLNRPYSQSSGTLPLYCYFIAK